MRYRLQKAIALCLLLVSFPATRAAPAEVVLPAPSEPAAFDSLGLPTATNSFSLDELPHDQIVLIAFSLYCPTCQKSARNFNRLAEAVQSQEAPLAVLCIGLGDTSFEVATFVRKFKLEPPSVPDRDRQIAQRFGIDVTPTTLLLEKSPQGHYTERWRRQGYLGQEHIQQLLEKLEER